MINKIRNIYLGLDIHTAEVVRKSASSTLVKVIGMVAGLILSIILARTIGAEGLGVINLANRFVTILIVLAMLGTPNVIIKYIAIAKNKNNLNRIGNVMFTAYLVNGSLGLILTIIVIIFAPLLTEFVFNSPELYLPLIIIVSVIIPQVFSRIFSAAFIGYKKVWQSNLVNETLSICIILLLVIFANQVNLELDIIIVAIMYSIGRLVVTFTTWIYWKKLFKATQNHTLIVKKLVKPAIPLFLVSAATIITANSSILILGWLKDVKSVGIYSVIATISMMTGFFLQITNSTISPKIAALFFEGKLSEIEKMIQKTTVGLIIIGAIVFFIFIFFGKNILLIWGNDFSNAYIVLIIISFGHFINISTGAAGLVLIMCGYEKTLKNISIYYLFINLTLNFILIYFYGIYGAAIATAITIVGENITKVIFAKKYVGIMTIPITNNFFKK